MTENDWFARYKFLQPIGQGGMGTVFLAEDKANDNKQRVIKQLNHKPTGDEFERSESVRLFRREADILQSLDHHGIVKVHDYHVSDDGKYFLVMDYVPGKNLEMIINTNGPLSSELVVRIGIHCCEVLEYLHGLKDPIIYRDLKPSNIMLTPDGRIVFIDFGIARQFMPKETATRVVTAGYSPPEQYFGKPETRSDIYSLGATMSHLLTGVRPKPLTACNPAVANPTVMPNLNALICRMTAHNLDDRPPSAKAVKFLLYKIYQEIHPEFEIPDEPDALLWDERAQAEENARLRYGRVAPSSLSNPVPAIERSENLITKQRAAMSSRDNLPISSRSGANLRHDPRFDEKPTLIERVMRWFENLGR